MAYGKREYEAQLAKRRANYAEKQARKAATQAQQSKELKANTITKNVAHLIGAHATPITNRTAKENITKAFDLMGGVAALVKWGKNNRTEFYRMWARLIPREAPEEQNTSTLETLLAMLAARGDQPVALAAYEIGVATMDRARQEVEAEDAAAGLAALEDGTLQ